MVSGREDGAQGRRRALGRVASDTIRRPAGCGEGSLEEGAGEGGIPPVAEIDIDDLPVLSDGPEQGAPAPTDLEQLSSTRHLVPTQC